MSNKLLSSKNDELDANTELPLLLQSEAIAFEVQHRCEKCNKLLGIEKLHLPSFDIKCHRCGHLNTFLNDYNRQIIITDKNGVILYVNSEVEKITGYSAQEILGKTPSIWGNQMTAEFYKSLWDNIKNGKRAVAVSITNKHKNGTLYKVILRISPILDINGDVEFFIGMETMLNDRNSDKV